MKFRFLTPHHLNDRVWAAGETAEVPADFVPSGACEPMDAEAVTAFYAVGPQPTPAVFNGLRVRLRRRGGSAIRSLAPRTDAGG